MLGWRRPAISAASLRSCSTALLARLDPLRMRSGRRTHSQAKGASSTPTSTTRAHTGQEGTRPGFLYNHFHVLGKRQAHLQEGMQP